MFSISIQKGDDKSCWNIYQITVREEVGYITDYLELSNAEQFFTCVPNNKWVNLREEN